MKCAFVFPRLIAAAIAVTLPTVARADATGPVATTVVKTANSYKLLRGGQPYFIKGAGGDASKQLLKDSGGNSFRTWGAGGLDAKLDEAQKLGLTVTIGIWLGHKEHGFNYNDQAAVAAQFEEAKKAILHYRNHPALLMWGIGNEMEGYEKGDDSAMWKAVEDIAKMAKALDPNHPTMTVIAEIGGDRVPCINKYCSDIDVIGINSYGGGPSIPERYKAAGGVKPYVFTEYGPGGTWEVGKTSWGAANELTSTEKAKWYRNVYDKAIANQPLCLGAYAFAWGNKQEATATWYGVMLPDGKRLGAVDALQEAWSGKQPANRAPEIAGLKLTGANSVAPGATVQVALEPSDPERDPLAVKWVLQYDPASYHLNGEAEAVPPTYPDAIVKSDNASATVHMPKYGGGYRLYAYVYDDHNGAAVANLPLFVQGGEDAPLPAAHQAQLPLTLYDEADRGDLPYIPSGYMGNHGAIKMDGECTDNPHAGKTCLKVRYTANDGWGGVVWQSPANDWGNAPGGWDIDGATRLTFWAHGEKGTEIVNFSFGLIGKDKKFHDSGSGAMEKVHLTTEWKQYAIELKGQDLSHIKTGFAWVVGADGQPITFYLDDIRYDSDATLGGAARPITSAAATIAASPKAPLPLYVYHEAGDRLPFIPSGYMGNVGAIKMEDGSTENPHDGKTCLKVSYNAGDGWGGVAWQNPANDWGSKPGGWDITGASKLTFWARGAKGGETVNFSFGLIENGKPYPDTASGKLDKVKLTAEWKQYSIDLKGRDLTRIKSGFGWVVGGQGEPLAFYLDDICYG